MQTETIDMKPGSDPLGGPRRLGRCQKSNLNFQNMVMLHIKLRERSADQHANKMFVLMHTLTSLVG